MPSLEMFFGFDMQGDACVLLQIINDNGEHIRCATESELRAYFREDSFDGSEIPENIGICVTCGGECDDDGQCENVCTECEEHYEDGGDGYDGKCPSCADAAQREEDEDEDEEADNA